MNNYNQIYDVQDLTNESQQLEPVTLEEMKDYLRLEGFTDADANTIESLSNFDFDDTLIEDMIRAARKKIERYCGISIVYHVWKVVFTNGSGEVEMPYGPLQGIVSLKYANNVVNTSYTIRTFDSYAERPYFYLLEPKGEFLKMEYEAGYDECPDELRLGIMQCVADWYENRIIGVLGQRVKQTVSPFKRSWTWLA